MPNDLSLVWVNKTQDSSSLSNCTCDGPIFSQIRSHILTVAHKSNRVKRPIKRRPLELNWVKKDASNSSAYGSDFSSQASGQQGGDNDLVSRHAVQSGAPPGERMQLGRNGRSFRPHRRRTSVSEDTAGTTLISTPIIHGLNGIADPFSSYSIQLDTAALDRVWYFANVWTQCAFKIPGCIGYGQAPIEPYEITAMIQQCLTSAINGYSLLAAASARMQYVHYEEPQAINDALGHSYARKALLKLRGRIQKHKEIEVAIGFSEEVATDILFLAAYEIFCSNEEGAQIHLTASLPWTSAATLQLGGLSGETDIRAVRVRTPQPAMTIINKISPLQNAADRGHCLQYMVAVTFLKGAVTQTLDYMDDSPWATDPRVDLLRERMIVVEDAGFTRDYYNPKNEAELMASR